jgi:large subunit ribosomal protein L23
MINCNLYDVIRSPIITEKTTMMSEYRKYTFKVIPDADKGLVKKAIEAIFGVKVQKVSMLNLKGKTKRFKGIIGKQSDMKKAIVTLEKDQVIDLAGGVK